jgi:hypothetical protein
LIFGSITTVPAVENELSRYRRLDAEKCALAQNLRYDDRVPEERAAGFLASVVPGLTLVDALRRYARDKIRKRNPEFTVETLNEVNLYPRNKWGFREPHPNLRLVRAINVNLLWQLFIEWKDRPDAPIWLRYLDLKGSRPYELHEKLSTRFGGSTGPRGLPADAIKALGFAGDIVEFLNQVLADVKTEPPPAWVTTWHSFKIYSKGSAIRWAQVLGVAHWRPPFWILLLKYPPSTGGTLVRPTQLDVGDCHWHFPSMRVTGVTQGGHPIDLAAKRRKLLPEWIHAATTHTRPHLRVCGGENLEGANS